MYQHFKITKQSGEIVPETSGKIVNTLLSGAKETGQLYSGLGLGGLGALLGAGIGGFTSQKGKRLRNALIGAGIGGAAGGAGGYYLSPHLKPFNFTYADTDKATYGDAVKQFFGDRGAGMDVVVNRPVSLAEAAGTIGNVNLLRAILGNG
jgi:hypothetical protein